MIFYYNGKKKSNNPDIFSGCLLLIGFGAIIFMLTMLKDVDDLKEYGFQIIIALIAGGSFVFSVFRKKGRIHNYKIQIKNSTLLFGDFKIPVEQITIDVYKKESSFCRYHLRDSKGKIAIYSVYEDDLLKNFVDTFPNQSFVFQELSSKHDGAFIISKSEKRSLFYNLETGHYKIVESDEATISFTPEIYTYDGKYKIGKPLKKDL